ncbi:hypothetical protein Ahy_Scaffold1g107226 [Arachis hypogaea]|uniref:Transposase MuDR plant domain-containing protein n=1 Tax=Arachis hypogaea TaxID=3818 RepID=A0A444WUW1_ARAHY|nr:hypothetical protein Ahy_Scaffold1g107226 [Arachis hypogaea]
MTPEINSLTALKNLILHSIGQQDTKMVKNLLQISDTSIVYVTTRTRNIRKTMVDLNMPPEGSQEGSNVEVRNADMMGDDVESHEGSAIRDPMMDQYEVNPDDGDDADDEPPEIPDDGDEEEEMNYYGETQIVLTQPTISRPYNRPDHFSQLNLDTMTSDWSFTQGGPEEDQSNEFEAGHQFQNKEEVMLVVKIYSIKRAAEYKIVESDHLIYNAQCI